MFNLGTGELVIIFLNVSKAKSMCSFSMINGGDRAMVSPVVLINNPAS